MPTQTKITDEDLTRKLEESHLPFNQKLAISPLIPAMDENERNELLKLIAQADEAETQRQEFETQYKKGLAALNEEYTRKMDQLVQDETNNARKEFENLSAEKEEKELKALESELNDIQP